MKTLVDPRARLKAKIEAARKAGPAVADDAEFAARVAAARAEYREKLRQGLAPVPSNPEDWSESV